MKIEKIYVYPVKALRAVQLDEVQVTKHGFPHDRRFMMLHVQRGVHDGDEPTYANIAVAKYPQSVLFFPNIDAAQGTLTITHKPAHGEPEATSPAIPLAPAVDGLEVVDVNMHGSPTTAYKMAPEYNAWLSARYGFDVLLVYLGPHHRPVLMSSSADAPRPFNNNNNNNKNDKPPTSTPALSWLSTLTSTAASLLPSNFHAAQPAEAEDPQLLTFNDCAPYLIASSKSMDDVRARFAADEAADVDIIKFRPNIIVSGADEAWDEDFWGEITIRSSAGAGASETKIECVHNCGRCSSINIDYATGAPGKTESGQLLKKLQRDRRVDPGMKYSPIFGRYSFLHRDSEGLTIRRGDDVVVSRRNEERTKFDWEGLSTLPSSK